MGIVTSIDAITEWVVPNICEKVWLKLPPPRDKAESRDYEYKLVRPAAYPMYIPEKDGKKPPAFQPKIPSVCVRLLGGEDSLPAKERRLRIQLALSAWSPGTHTEDVFYAEEPQPFVANGEGWRDLWNFIDTAVGAIEQSTSIGNMGLATEEPLKFGPYKEDEAILDYYPFWFGWVEFSLKTSVAYRNPYQNMI